ncbi:hypothetical protein C8A05DRAFT_37984 [Staphylotrichum tortipilum]|uniref:Uncharacterized protein n=1 Tax=Staphylotrichum tortipilum TaxID=2831512 RepID=A0AAN6ME74_9PEZI|nr:hypothetical protein C8A05DRAFT_37984 [Staphylotrichum longicolle]
MLRLTQDTRRCIHFHAGVGRQQPVDQTAPSTYSLNGPRVAGRAPRPFHGLLLSCHTIYIELSTLLYSEHCFIVPFDTHQSLAPLRALAPTPCHEFPRNGNSQPQCCNSSGKIRAHRCGEISHQGFHDAPLAGSSDRTQAVPDEWLSAAAYLARYVDLGRLKLSLVCDVGWAEIEMATRILDSLRLLPRLKDCHLRLSGTCEPPLQHLAQDTVDDVCGIRWTRGPSLMDLPCELRLRILKYTNLVTPYREMMPFHAPPQEVLWGRANRCYRIKHGPCAMFPGKDICRRYFHRGCRFSNSHGRLVACLCWVPPAQLFLVCRALRWDAALVFFGRNRFTVLDGPHANPFVPWLPGDYPHNTLAASHFLRRVVPEPCMSHLRELDLAFAPFNHIIRPSYGHPALLDWAETVEWTKDKLNLPRLSLRVVLPGNGNIRPEAGWSMTNRRGKQVLEAYQTIVTPLRLFTEGGLDWFESDMAWPLRWSGANYLKSWS